MAVIIPENVSFPDLDLHFAGKGKLGFNTSIMRLFLTKNDVDPEGELSSFENIAPLVLSWYMQHRLNGGADNEVLEHMFQLVDAKIAKSSEHMH